jgi:hypothetical protein
MPPLLAIPHFYIEQGQGSAGPGPGGAFGMKKEETSGATHAGSVRPATVCVVGGPGAATSQGSHARSATPNLLTCYTISSGGSGLLVSMHDW